MKSISPYTYAKAFLEVSELKPGVSANIFQNFITVIKRNGDWPRRHAITSAVEKLWRAKHNRPLVTIESARHLTPSQQEELVKSFPASYDFENVIHPELVAGARLTVNDEYQRDGSLAYLLKKIFS